ncbi:MAG: thiamine pyrophosphate-binding protein [Hyphomicrobiaceae bacterium]
MTARVADIVAETLSAHDIRHAFGMPGGEVVTLVDALNQAGVEFTLARHETAAAIMAAGAFSVTGAPGLLVTTLGPGLANAVNGIADASQEHVPLIVISGVVDHNIRGTYTHQVVDHKKLLHPLVKASFEVETEGVGATVARAISVAMAHPMGPVHIDLAPETAAKLATADDAVVKNTPKPRPKYTPDSPEFSLVYRALEKSQRPIMIAGLDAVKDGAGPALTKLAENYQIPVLTTYKAKGTIDEDHPLSLGAAGLSPLADKTILPLVAQSDLILLVGYDPIEMRQPWCQPFKPNQHVIALGPPVADHGMHRGDLHIEGPTELILQTVLDHPEAPDTPAKWPDGAPSAAKNDLLQAFKPPTDWGPHSVFTVLQDTKPENSIVTVDSGAHRILLSQMMRFQTPNTLLQSAGFCTMGAAVPLATGARKAAPEITAISVVGDGGLEMGLGELATLRDQSLPVVIIVLQDHSLALIELKQRQAGLAQAGVKLGATRFEDIAEAFGGKGERVTSAQSLARALTAAYACETFTVIVAEIEAEAYAGRI